MSFLRAPARRVSVGTQAADEHRRRSDEEIMNEMSERFFGDKTPDAVTASVLESLPEDADCAYLENALREHQRALDIVNGDISARVLSSHSELGP